MANISRRSFVELSIGALMSLPTVVGGYLALTPQEALARAGASGASEQDGGAYSGAEAEIIVVRPWEVAFMVVDMSDGGNTRISGANVTIYSRYNQKTVSGVTDDKGVVLLDISTLAVRPDDGSDPRAFFFNGAITVDGAAGYRTFKTKLVRVLGGAGLIVPSRRIDDDKPYPVSVAFDDWDVLYTIESYSATGQADGKQDPGDGYVTFNASPKNVDAHALEVELANLAAKSSVTVQFCQRSDSKKILETTVTADDSGHAVATFKKCFLKSDDPEALPYDTDFDIHFVYASATYDFPIKLRSHKTIFPEPLTLNSVADKNKRVKPLTNIKNATMDNSGFRLTLPSGMPVGGGDVFTCWMPEFPINIYADPTGYVQLMVRTPTWGYMSDSGKPDQAGWKTTPRKCVTDQMSDLQKKWDTGMENMLSALQEGGGMPAAFQPSMNFSLQAYLRFIMVAQWSETDKVFNGNAAGQAVLAEKFSYVQHFLAGPVPVFIQFDFNSSLTISLGAGTVIRPKSDAQDLWDAVCDFGCYEWDYTNSGLTFTVIFSPALSAGVGVAGVLAISLRGMFSLSFFVGITTHGSDQKLPHVIVGYGYQADIVVQFLLFSYAFNIFKGANDAYYDNWRGLTGQAEDDALGPMAGMSMADFIKGFKPITDEMLAASAEFEDDKEIKAQAEDEALQEGDQAKPEIYFEGVYDESFVTDDGTVLPRMVYTLGVRERQDAPSEQVQDAQVPDEAAAIVSEAPDTGEGAPAGEAPDAAAAAAAVALTQMSQEPEELVAQTEGALEADPLVALSDEGAIDTEGLETAEIPVDVAPVEDVIPEAGDADALTPTEEVAETPDAAQPAPEESPAEEATPPADEQEAVEEVATVESPFAQPIPGSWTPIWQDDAFEGELAGMADTTPGISGIGDHGGLDINGEAVLASKVFGNPHLKVVEIGGTVYALRIGTVKLRGKYLTRIIATTVRGKRSAGRRTVLNFTPTAPFDGAQRDDLCDYEFDAKVQGDCLHVAVISGRRNDSLASAATDLVLSHVLFHHSAASGFDQTKFCMSWTGAKVFGEDKDYPYHCITNVNLQVYQHPSDDYQLRDVATLAYLDRRAATAEGTLSDSGVSVTVGFVFTYSADFPTSINAVSAIVIDPNYMAKQLGDVDPTTFDFTLWQELTNTFTFCLRGSKKNQLFTLRRSRAAAGIDTSKTPVERWEEKPGVEFVHHVADMDLSEQLHAWKTDWVRDGTGMTTGYQLFLYSHKDNGKLTAARVDSYFNTYGALKTWGTGPTKFGSNSFGTLGEIVYWPETRNGSPGHAYDEKTASLKPMANVDECHLMAARIKDGQFCDPFIIAELKHNVDSVMAISALTDKTALSVVCAEMTDRVNDLATIRYLQIPLARVVTATAAMAVNPFVAPGKAPGFHVTLQNNGNTWLSGCDIEMYDKANLAAGAASTGKATFSLNTLCESAWNPLDDQGKLTNCDPDGALAPGKTGVYLVQITVPEGWSGRKDVVLVAKNGIMIDGMTSQAEDESGEQQAIEYHLDPQDVSMEVLFVQDNYWHVPRYSDSPVTVIGPDEQTPQGDNPDGSPSQGAASSGTASRGNSSASGNGRLPRTGDNTSLAAAAGIAAAGAAAAAAGALLKGAETADDDTE